MPNQYGEDPLAILQQHQWFKPVLDLASMRRDRRDELTDRIANAIGMGDRRAAQEAKFRRDEIDADMAEDPYLGDLAKEQDADTSNVLHQSALSSRPDVLDAQRAKLRMAADVPYEAEASPTAQGVLDTRSRRQIDLAKATAGARADAKPLTADDTKSVVALHQAVTLGNKLRGLLVDKLGANPEEARDKGVMGQVADVGKAQMKRFLYGQHILQSPDGYDEATQLEDWMKVLASKGLMSGMRNMEWVRQIQDHLVNGTQPPATALQRLDEFLKMAPQLENDVYSVEKGHERLAPFAAQTPDQQMHNQPPPQTSPYQQYAARGGR